MGNPICKHSNSSVNSDSIASKQDTEDNRERVIASIRASRGYSV